MEHTEITILFGSVISILLAIIGWFLSRWHSDMKEMLKKHDDNLDSLNINMALVNRELGIEQEQKHYKRK